MKLSKSQIETLIGMPDDLLKAYFLTKTLEEAESVCAQNAKLKDRCEKGNLYEKKARKYIQYYAPHSAPILNNLDQARLIEREFVTTYNYDKRSGEISFGYVYENVNFSIKGIPQSGTIVHLFESYPDESTSSNITDVFFSIEDMFESLKNPIQDPNTAIDMFKDYHHDMMADDLSTPEEFLEHFTNELAKYTNHNDDADNQFAYHRVELP